MPFCFQELGDTDPLTLAQVHEHLVRSPPPASWSNTPMFHFPHLNNTDKSDSTAHYNSPPKTPARHINDVELSRSDPPTDIRGKKTKLI